jgi:hypothetical protein
MSVTYEDLVSLYCDHLNGRHDGPEDYYTECVGCDRYRLQFELDQLVAQRDKVLALCAELDCSNCEHAVKLHDASPTGECTHQYPERACGCDWSNALVEDIRAIYAEPTSEATS